MKNAWKVNLYYAAPRPAPSRRPLPVGLSRAISESLKAVRPTRHNGQVAEGNLAVCSVRTRSYAGWIRCRGRDHRALVSHPVLVGTTGELEGFRRCQTYPAVARGYYEP